jgi:hypothetical protein
MRTPSWRYGLWAAVLVALGPTTAVAQPTIVFDYQYDTGGFFADQLRRDALQAAATRLQSRLADTLTAISPTGGNTYQARFFHPATGLLTNHANLAVPQNQIIVFAGGRDLSGSTLGQGGPGGFQNASGDTAFLQSLARGQYDIFSTPGVRTDFGAWGGSITFDTPTNWNFSITNGPGAGQSDFYSVALHELAHLLGFGTSDSFINLAPSPPTFNGTASNALLPGVQVTADRGHWASGTSYLGQQASMTPSITVGTRKEFTELDFAGLDDLGWQVTPIPEPTTVFAVAAAGLAGAWGVRRKVVKRLAA